MRSFFKSNPGSAFFFKGIGKFGRRVIYIKVKEHQELAKLQGRLSLLCKTDLKLKLELSDYAYHPHMTLAFKDVKKPFFLDYFEYLKTEGFSGGMEVEQAVLLKKEDRQWVVFRTFPIHNAYVE